MSGTRTIAIIPARMGSSRFPGKPLAELLGKPMVQHVWERASAASLVDEAIIATCDDAIARAARGFGAHAVMTSAAHERASDRAAQAAAELDADIIVMVQGDEPMLSPEMIDSAVEPMLADPSIGCVNLAAPIETRSELEDPNTIKVVFDARGDALYFSRMPIPTHAAGGTVRAWKQVCVIPFRAETLRAYASLEPTAAERAESIDMLRFLEHGLPVRMVRTSQGTRAVDTADDLRAVEALMRLQTVEAA
jgi:3-deoxy-manno-octulosonate cytidylyltransferase (CMP-KDO synthetase)